MIKRTVIPVIVIICAFFCLTGCGDKSSKMEELLEEKYHEEFKIGHTWTTTLGADVRKAEYHAICSPAAHPEVKFEISVQDFGEKKFTDDYAQGIVAAQLSELMAEKLCDEFGECYVYTGCMGKSPEFPDYASVTIADYAAKAEEPWAYYDIFVNTDQYTAEDYAAEFDALCNVLTEMEQDSGMNTTMSVYFLPDDMCEMAEIHLTTYRQWNSSLEDEIKRGYSQYTFAFDENEQVWRHNIYETPDWKVRSITKDEYINCRQNKVEAH